MNGKGSPRSSRKIEVGSSYTMSNFTRVTHFLDRGFLLELMVRKTLLPINIYCLSPQLTYLILQRESNTLH